MLDPIPFQPIPPQDFKLTPQRIDIWQYPLSMLWDEANTLLNEEEYKRASRYHFDRHRRRFTVARALLRLILGRYLQVDPKSIKFTTNDYGKPSVAEQTDLQFNLSHSQELALLAIGQTQPMGIDLEHFSARPLAGMANTMFSPQEITAFSQVPTRIRPLSFFHVWAQKEAFIKACGMGLSYPTQSFTVPVLPPTHALINDPKHACTWQIHSFMPEAACCAALCAHPDIQSIRYRTLAKDPHVSLE
ncbi:MAG: 4'-phosphopantetheinyl transferase superfamily protein [Gammaproteobacteria bacterium]|nr:4'-phosphopantetheinyl transferase superfamily protein [Gammaproteobacteria bacterium]